MPEYVPPVGGEPGAWIFWPADYYCDPACLDVNSGPCDTDGGGPCADQYDGQEAPRGE